MALRGLQSCKAKLQILGVEDGEVHSPFSSFSLSPRGENFSGLLEAVLERGCLDSQYISLHLARVRVANLIGQNLTYSLGYIITSCDTILQKTSLVCSFLLNFLPLSSWTLHL